MFVSCWGSEKAYLCVTLNTHGENKQTIISMVNSSQLCSTKWSTCHTILGCDELTMRGVDWHPVYRYIAHLVVCGANPNPLTLL